MEIPCSEGHFENAVNCCFCELPLLCLCDTHAKEHLHKDSGFHFILPLWASQAISTTQLYTQAKVWLQSLTSRYETLRMRLVEFSRCEEEIESAFQEIARRVSEMKRRLNSELSIVKAEFQTAIESAISETSLHALETEFAPTNSLTELLWYSDPTVISTCQMYSNQVSLVIDQLDSALKVSVVFTAPGFEHLKVEHYVQSPIERGERHPQELEDLSARLEDATRSTATLERNLTQMSAELEMVGTRNKDLCREISIAHQELNNKETQVSELRDNLAAKEKEWERLKWEMNEQIFTLNVEAKAKDIDNLTLRRENESLKDQVSGLVSQLTQQNEVSENLHRALTEASNPPRGFLDTKPIAVLKDRVLFYDIPTGSWRKLIVFKKQLKIVSHSINVDHSSSSVFTAGDRVFVCGGGTPPCMYHADNSAYLLEGTGSVLSLPPMQTGRKVPGIIWDWVAEALYVFGGFNEEGMSHTGLRSSEQFKMSRWESLPDMWGARYFFNPCWHTNVVYLCGGRDMSIETYDPFTNRFTLLDLRLPEDSDCTAVIETGELSVLSFNYISRRQHGRFTKQEHTQYKFWSNCTPVISEGSVFIVSLVDLKCREINLATGTLTKEVSLK